jgi:GDP-4-dehydro-6-deoxy-D-mannose reductase
VNLLLLGATGFVGAHVREAAAAKGMRVTGSSRTGGRADLTCDLSDPRSLAAALEESRPDVVMNMAGASSVAASWRNPSDALAVNAAGVRNLLEAVEGVAPTAFVLCVSSAEVYGEVAAGDLPVTEDRPLSPATPYGESKAEMEAICAEYSARGLRIAVVRAFNQLGPGQSPAFVASGFAREIASAERDAREVAELRVGNLSAARDFTDARDSARAYLAVCELGLAGVFNLCKGEAVTISRLLETMAANTRLEVRAVPDPDLARPVDVPVVYGSAERLRTASGWEPRIPLERTLADTLDWWREDLQA